MKTAHYIFTTWNDGTMAAGFGSHPNEGRSAALVRVPEETDRVRKDNVIDLTTWRAVGHDESWEGADWEYVEPDRTDEEPDQTASASRERRSRRAEFAAELISTLCVVAVAVVLIVRVLTF